MVAAAIALHHESNAESTAGLDRFLTACERFSPQDAASAEQAVRKSLSFTYEPWEPRPGSATRAIPWLDLMSWNGYRREAALAYAAKHPVPNPLLMAVMLRRLNDWVPQVRRAAITAVERAGAQTETSVLEPTAANVLPSLRAWGRIDQAGITTLRSLRALPEVMETMLQRIGRQHDGPMAHLLSAMADLPQVDPQLPDFSRNAVQPSVRAVATRWLLAGEAEWTAGFERVWTDKRFNEAKKNPLVERRPLTIQPDQIATLRQAAEDPSPRVRRIAGDALVRRRQEGVPELNEFARQLSRDPYPSVAERATYFLEHSRG